MGVIQGFHILFTNGKNVYTAKEHVTGEVFIAVSEPTKVKSVELTLRGHAKVTRSGNLQKPVEQDKARMGQVVNEYLNTKLQLTAGSATTLPVGQSRLPFSFLLPEGLPTSFESKHARIRYWLEAVIVRTWFKSKRRTLQGFTIIEHVDINQPELLVPVNESREHHIGCLCRKSFQASVTLDRKGYCPGETIPVNLEIQNGTKRAIQSQMALIQETAYRIKGKTFTDNQQINTMDLGVLPKNQRHCANNYYIQLPPIAPSIISCKIITVSYKLQFTVGLTMSKEKVVFDAPFTVGTIPYREPPPPQQPLPNSGFTVELPSPMEWPGGFAPSMGMELLDPPPKYPGGPSPPSLPSAPPLPEYESGSGTFMGNPPKTTTSTVPLRNAPDLPEFSRSPSDSRISPCPAMRPPSPCAPKPRSHATAPRPTTPTAGRSSPSSASSAPNGRPLVLPKLEQNKVQLKPVRTAPTKLPSTRDMAAAPPTPPSSSPPPPVINPNLHVFQDTSTSGDNCVHAYAECIFGGSDGRSGGDRGDDFEDGEDQDPDTYNYVPIYAWAFPTVQQR
ncbi:arrestin domain-containing protein 2-like [Diadema antillarum]|uniref:arrestin domain-containing protein 2-like n=1 Tax=Diadema antillarum TaxID=105358 RepID=UPI003A8B8EAD